ncbi:hypothetical protein K2X05_06850 [bacterium]|nr:hypothetical protein [bacterium]
MTAAENISYTIEQELQKQNRKFKLNPQILIVEDDITSEPLWEHIIQLASPKAYFDWATSESEAEHLIRQSKQRGQLYDLVISDIFLSGSKTGIDLWHNFNDILKGRMILISSIDHHKFVKYCGEEQNRPVYIKKPLNLSDCIETVYSILKER